jgi:hypothetical protein
MCVIDAKGANNDGIDVRFEVGELSSLTNPPLEMLPSTVSTAFASETHAPDSAPPAGEDMKASGSF